MRIAHVIQSVAAAHGGPSRSVPQLAVELQKRSVEGVIAHVTRVTDEWSRQAHEAVKAGVEVQEVRWASSPTAYSLIASVDVVHFHGIWSPWLHQLQGVAKRARKRIVVSPRGMLEPWARQHHKWRKVIAWTLFQESDLNCADVIHATSDQEAANLKGLLRGRVVVIPNGTPVPSRIAAFSGERRIVFLSRIHAKKGLLMLVQAASALRLELAERGWQFVVAGPDEGHQMEVERAAARGGVSNLFSFIGSVDDRLKWDVLLTGHLFVLPTYSENFGIAIAEGLAAGLPVITTTSTPWQEIEAVRAGWWVAPDTDAITEALRDAIGRSTSELQEMGLRGRALVASRYSWPAAAEQFEMLYAEILAPGGRG